MDNKDKIIVELIERVRELELEFNRMQQFFFGMAQSVTGIQPASKKKELFDKERKDNKFYSEMRKQYCKECN